MGAGAYLTNDLTFFIGMRISILKLAEPAMSRK